MIDHQHLTPELLAAVSEGHIPPAQVLRQLSEVAQVCETCQAALHEWRDPGIKTGSSFCQLLQHTVTPTPDEKRAAKRDLRTLLKMPRAEREKKIGRANKRYRSPALTESLLAMSEERRAVDADKAYHYAQLAQRVVHRCSTTAQVDDLRALCLAYLAAADKARGNLDAAGERFRVARATLGQIEAPALLTQARIDFLEGTYWKDRRELEHAEQLLSHAITLYELLRETQQVARTRLVLGGTQFYAGREQHAISTVKLALTAIDPKAEPRLFLMAHHNVALYLCEMGQSVEAAKHFKTNQPRYELARHDWPSIEMHFHWLAGKIQRSLDKLPQAERHLVRARDGFAEHGTNYDAILVCLDLALVYATQKRHGELSELTDLMVSGFAAQGLHDEALAAVSLAAEAARKRRLTEELARKISHFLQFARHDPSLKRDF